MVKNTYQLLFSCTNITYVHFGGESPQFQSKLPQNLHTASGLLTLHGETLGWVLGKPVAL